MGGQYMQASKYLNPGQGNVLVPNVAEPSFTTLYQNDFSESSFNRSAFKQQNSVEAAFGKIPKGGFIKAHNAEEEPGDPHPVEIKYIYGDRNPLRLGDDPNPERPMRKAVDYAQEGIKDEPGEGARANADVEFRGAPGPGTEPETDAQEQRAVRRPAQDLADHLGVPRLRRCSGTGEKVVVG